MGCGASSAVPPSTVDPKHWPAVLRLMDEAERQRARAVAAEARLRQLQRLVADETGETNRAGLPKGLALGPPRSAQRLDMDMRRAGERSDWWWMADREAQRTIRDPRELDDDRPALAPPPPPPRRRVVLPPLEPLEG